jgi:hypothetical protein
MPPHRFGSNTPAPRPEGHAVDGWVKLVSLLAKLGGLLVFVALILSEQPITDAPN